MKRTFLLLLAMLPGLSWAKPLFEQGKKYRLMCTYWMQGSVVDGQISGQKIPIFYDTNDEESLSAYWYVTETSDGKFTIQSGALEFENEQYSVLKIVADNIEGGLQTIQGRMKRYEKNI